MNDDFDGYAPRVPIPIPGLPALRDQIEQAVQCAQRIAQDQHPAPKRRPRQKSTTSRSKISGKYLRSSETQEILDLIKAHPGLTAAELMEVGLTPDSRRKSFGKRLSALHVTKHIRRVHQPGHNAGRYFAA